MGIDVTVLRVFTDSEGNFGNPLGVVDASTVPPPQTPTARHPIGLQRNDIHRSARTGIDHRQRAHLHPGHRVAVRRSPDGGRGLVAEFARHPGQHLAGAGRHRAGDLRRGPHRGQRPLRSGPRSSRFTTWTRSTKLAAADPDDYSDDIEHYLWTWTDKPAGEIRVADVRAAPRHPRGRGHRGRGGSDHRLPQPRPRHHPGKGSRIETQWSPEGWVRVAGRVVNDGSDDDRLKSAVSPLRGPRGARAAPRSRARSRRPR